MTCGLLRGCSHLSTLHKRAKGMVFLPPPPFPKAITDLESHLYFFSALQATDGVQYI